MRKAASCVSLKLASIQMSVRDHPVDLGHHIAIPELQDGLIEKALRLGQFRLSLFHRWCLGEELRIDTIDVALGVALVEVGDQLLSCGAHHHAVQFLMSSALSLSCHLHYYDR